MTDENKETLPKTGGDNGVPLDRMVLPLDVALIRWSVVHRAWHESANDMPLLLAFLAGWSCRCIGASMPENLGIFRDSFRVGWREADDQIVIASRQNQELCDPKDSH